MGLVFRGAKPQAAKSRTGIWFCQRFGSLLARPVIFDFHVAGGGEGFELLTGPGADLDFDFRGDDGDQVVGIGLVAAAPAVLCFP